MKNTKIELKNSRESFKSGLDHTKETTRDPEDRTLDITQSKEQKERMKKSAEGLQEFIGSTKKKQHSHYGNSRRKTKRERDTHHI